MPLIRLQRFLSQAGIASRRAAEQLILKGELTVNGEVVRELGTKIDPEKDRVSFRGKPISSPQKFSYYILYKPPRVMVTKRDPEGRKTVYDLIPSLDSSINAVGRLDYASEGLLLLTNDGEFAYRLTHPSFEIKKTYQVRLDHLPPAEKIRAIESGILMEGHRTAPAQIKIIQRAPFVLVSIQIHEGKNREVRRMFEWAGGKIKRLTRVKFGSLKLENLKSGEWRSLTHEEIVKLKKDASL